MNRYLVFAASAAVIGWSAHADGAGIPLTLALEAAQAAIETCKANGYDVTVTILDPDLSTRLVMRSDGARDGTVQIAYRKAYTVIKTGMSSGDFGKTVPAPSVAPPPGPPGPVNGDPNLITWTGGLPIKVGNNVVGSISASGAPGGEKDEACVRAGLVKIAGKLK
jgi:uncharacterized protein GlcG (DUF336 family)